MRDPEITFLVTPKAEGKWQWKPLTFRNDYGGVYQVAAEYDNFGSIRMRDARVMRELSEFASQWDLNLKHQGFIEASHREPSERDSSHRNTLNNRATEASTKSSIEC